MVTETDRNKARSAVVSAYQALDCVDIPFSFLHAFADAAVDAVSTDAEPVPMDDEDRTPMPAGFDDALWQKADEIHHAMALVARDQECVKIIYAGLSTHNAEPVKTAPAVAVKALEWDGVQASSPTGFYRVQRLDDKWEPLHNGYYMLPRLHGVVKAFDTQEEAKAHCQKHHNAAIRSAVAAQVQDVAVPEGWQLVPKEPTEEMHNAARDWAVKKYGLGIGFDGSDGCYRAMISTAPASPASKHGDAE